MLTTYISVFVKSCSTQSVHDTTRRIFVALRTCLLAASVTTGTSGQIGNKPHLTKALSLMHPPCRKREVGALSKQIMKRRA